MDKLGTEKKAASALEGAVAGHSNDSPLKRTSRKKAQGQKRRHALTVKNVLRELKELVWSDLCYVLCLQRTRIEKNYATEDERRNAAVSFWMTIHPYASWRLLIRQLVDWNKHTLAERIHPYAEKLTDPSLTHENITMVTAKGKDGGGLEDILDLPISKRVKFKGQMPKMIDYFIKYSPYASWRYLAGRLYFNEEHEALSAVRKFIKGTPEPTLTLSNLTTLMTNVSHNWYYIGVWIDIPDSKREMIKTQHSDDYQRSRACWQVYLTDHPFPTWQLLSQALYWSVHIEELEVVQKKYLKGTAENRRQFEEEMRRGRIKLWLTKLLMYGAAGSGKTSTKEWIVGNPPPADRTSTPLAMRPTTICRVNLNGGEFSKISTLQERKVFLAQALKPAKPDDTPRSDEDTLFSPKPIPTAAASQIKSTDPKSSKQFTQPSSDEQPSSSSGELAKLDDGILDESIDSKVDAILESISTSEELVKLMDHLSTTVHPLVCFRLIQMVDCGGQSPFLDVLPIFMKKLSFYMFVFRLCDDLTKHPVIEFFTNGKKFGTPFVSPLSVEQLLQHCVRSIRSYKPSTVNIPELSHGPSNADVPPLSHESSTAGDHQLTKIMIVGTHLDEVKKSTESLDEKNKKILKILSPLEKEQVIFHKLSNKEVIFPINAKVPGKSEDEIVKQVRDVLLSDHSGEAAEVPSRWFALEILLEEMTQALDRGILSRDDCTTAAVEKLHFEEDAVESALLYLDQLSVLFYYPEILPDVVFTNPQVVVNKISELVFKSSETEKISEERALSGEWVEFHEWALVTTKFLSKEFNSHYVPGLFEVNDLVKLFIKLLVFAVFSATHFFVPSLLCNLDSKEVDKHRVSTIPSLVLQFPDGGPRQGIFCSLLCWLAGSENDSPAPWSISKIDNNKPKCLHRNCVQFDFPESPAVVTLIDTYLHFEVHVYIPSKRIDKLCPKILPKVRTAIFKGIKRAAVNTDNYDCPPPTPALICPCGKGEAHIATANPEYGWTCTLDKEECDDLTPHQLLWIVAPTKHERLTESHFDKLYSQLKEYASKWRDIGTFLHFHEVELDNICMRLVLLEDAPESWLGAVLSEWLCRDPNDRRGGPSIDNLKLALQSSGLGAVSFDL